MEANLEAPPVSTATPSPPVVAGRPAEAWILVGRIDGRPAAPEIFTPVAGLPHLVRDACAVAEAGVERIVAVWNGDAPPPDLEPLRADPRPALDRLELALSPPDGDPDDPILVVRGDRVFHRDLPRLVAGRGLSAGRSVVEIAGAEHDAVFLVSRRTARELCAATDRAGGLAAAISAREEQGEVDTVEPPWLGFTVAAPDRRGLRRAEKRLVSSLRKLADGFAAQVLNRHVSLFFTRYLARTPVRPNHVTVFCFLAALSGAFSIAHATYWSGVVGFLLVELGSILDGIDGELSRLKYQGSRLGQWMDTVTDDISNVCFVVGTLVALDHGGVGWAVPLGVAALVAFAITQSTQYYYIAVVYHSGDLAAIPWAFQSKEGLEARPRDLLGRVKSAIPRFLKRDFVVTLFVVLAFAGRLDAILLIWSAGAFGFLFAFAVQWIRNRPR